MPEPYPWDKPYRLLSDLCRLVAERAPAERELPAAFAARNEAIESEHRVAQSQLALSNDEASRRLEAEHTAVRSKAEARSRADHRAAEEQFDDRHADLVRRFEDSEWSVEQRWKTARWEATTVYEATKDQPALMLQEIESRVAAGWEEIQAIARKAAELLRRRRQPDALPARPASPPPEAEGLPRLERCVAEARDALARLEAQRAAAWFEGARPASIFLLAWLAAVLPSMALWPWIGWFSIPASLAAGAALGTAATVRMYRAARAQSIAAAEELGAVVSAAGPAREASLAAARADCERKRQAIVDRVQGELKKADDAHAAAAADVAARKKREFHEFEHDRAQRFFRIAADRERELAAIEESFTRRRRETDESYRRETERLADRRRSQLAASHDRFRSEWDEMTDRWYGGIALFHSQLQQLNLVCDHWFPDWDAVDWDRWTPPAGPAPPIRFGQSAVDLARIPDGLPDDRRLRPTQTAFTLPLLLPFPSRSLLLVKSDGAGGAAVRVLQAAMLRMLAALPPGKVRFTIFDPVGLGENFAGFMHLADYDEQLVTSRIWTEPAHIERRLADLTEHMENVLQAYLRNEFRSIQEYNAFAGEMAEPYRVLVAAGFPANFSETAARRLASIVSSGARCGVFTLLSVDTGLAAPRDFRTADLDPHAFTLHCRNGRAVWEHESLGALPVEADAPPCGEHFTRVVRAIGRRVQQAGKVEVPFASIVPEEPSWWTADSRLGIDVPLGRIGGTKCQRLQLGRGTSQHVLVSGKTGSGKSTLLHVLITSLALHYRPDEVELYLVDFKKGVEFKTYARRRLPHARVVAVESEREFGLSVLERLDAELKERGDLFRRHGVQDLPAYRAARPGEKLPRALLVVDEFQELFVEDDRVAQKAALLLDRLVRQGRAFGIHVLLGSQTLAGNYSLPRSTIGQMAVRIALQCSEADAHLILSEENTAARLLTRPGEAIYNDANGLYEGNHPFQVVWLPDADRDRYLEQVGRLADRDGLAGPSPIVFEGNADADPDDNPALTGLLASPEWPAAAIAPKAWLGTPVAIQAPTCVEFGRAGGNNLLAIGHRDETAAGVLAAAVLSLAAQQPPGRSANGPLETTFYLFDGSRRDAPEAGFWPRVAEAMPHGARVVTPRDSAAAVAEIAERLAAREQSGREDEPAIYLVVYNLSRFPELRKAEDDYGFARMGGSEPPSPARQFAKVLRDGPALGIHTLVWCDTYNNVGRWLDRQGLRDVEIRVLFQMNATDSSQLIDSPAASQLGPHRAILYHEGLGQLEKFRPYGVPSEAWLARVREQLGRKCAAVAAPPEARQGAI